MKQQPTTEPNLTAIPEIYSTMPNKWTKWKRMGTNEQKNKLSKELGFYDSVKPLSTTFLDQN